MRRNPGKADRGRAFSQGAFSLPAPSTGTVPGVSTRLVRSPAARLRGPWSGIAGALLIALAASFDGPAPAAEGKVGERAPAPGVTNWKYWNAYFDKALDLKGKEGGYALIVLKDANRVIERAEGWARAPWEKEKPGVKMTIHTPVQLASVCKPITAVCFLKTWEFAGRDDAPKGQVTPSSLATTRAGTAPASAPVRSGKFSLDDPFWAYSERIRKLFPKATEQARTITFRQLLTHRSGLSPASWDDPNSLRNSVHLMLAKPLQFRPGEKYSYNNGNFCLLRVLTEEISGVDFMEFLGKHVTGPLDMKTLTGRNADPPTLHYKMDDANLPGFAFGLDNGWRFGADGGFASADDMAKFLVGVRYYRVLSRETTERMFDEKLGWHVMYEGPEGKGYNHSGFWTTGDGRCASTEIAHLPEGIDAVILRNNHVGRAETLVRAYRHSKMEHLIVGAVPPPPDVHLGDLKVVQRSGPYGFNLDRNFAGGPLCVGLERFSRGMGVHAPAKVTFDLKDEYKRFVARVGRNHHGEFIGTVAAEVWVDGKKLHASPVLRGGDDPWNIDVELPAGGKQITLVTTDAGDGNNWEAVDWGSAGFLIKK